MSKHSHDFLKLRNVMNKYVCDFIDDFIFLHYPVFHERINYIYICQANN